MIRTVGLTDRAGATTTTRCNPSLPPHAPHATNYTRPLNTFLLLLQDKTRGEWMEGRRDGWIVNAVTPVERRTPSHNTSTRLLLPGPLALLTKICFKKRKDLKEIK